MTMQTMQTTHFTGLIAAPHTPFGPDGEVNLDIVPEQANGLIEQGVGGAFICGTTGEGPSLSVEERRALAERWTAAAGSQLDVIVHVGHNSMRDTRALAAHARGLNVSAIGFMPPTIFKVQTVGQLVDLCREVADAAGDLPLYYYHIPSLTGVHLPMVDFLREAGEAIPTLRGIKFTHNDLMEYRQCLTFDDGRFDVLFGRDEMLLAGLAYGGRGAVGSTYNYAAPLYLSMMAAFDRGDLDEARRLADQSIAMVRTVVAFGELPAAKAILVHLGIDVGPPRPPLPRLDDATRNELHGMLDRGDLPVHKPTRPTA